MKAGFYFAAIFVGVFSLLFGYSDRIVAMGMAMGLCIVLLAFANLDRFSSIKASPQGIEGELREARAVVKEANATLSELRDLAIVMAKIQVSLLARSGRLGGYSDDEQETYRRDTMALLSRIGVSAEKQAEVLSDAHRLTAMDYLQILVPSSPPMMDHAHVPTWHALHFRIYGKDLPGPDELETFFNAAQLWGGNSDRRDWLEDYRFYLREKRHRRPDKWEKRPYEHDHPF